MGPRSVQRTPALQRINHIAADHALANGRAIAAHRPLHVFLQIASGCNLECYMCSEHARPPELRRGRGMTSLPREIFDKIAREVFPYSSMVFIGVGGEPMLSPDFQHFVRSAFEAGQYVNLTTNGTRFDREGMAETIASCVADLQVSIDAATRETYERIRVGSHWSRIRANLELLNQFRLRQSKEERTRLTLCMVLMKSNVHELPAFVEFAHEFHADVVQAQHVIPITPEGLGECLLDEPARYDHFREIAVERARQLGIELTIPLPYGAVNGSRTEPHGSAASTPAAPPASAQAPRLDAVAAPFAASAVAERSAFARHGPPVACKMPTLETFILHDGSVYPCCHPYAHKKMKVGDLRTQSFAEIWNGSEYRNLRAGLQSGDMPPMCRTCSLVHNPPPAYEDPDAILGGPDISQWYAGRDLAPLGGESSDPALFDNLRAAGVLGWVDDLSSHAWNLERRDAGRPWNRVRQFLRRASGRGTPPRPVA